MLKEELERRKEKIKEFIRNNPTTTHKNIKNKLRLKVEKSLFWGNGRALKKLELNFLGHLKLKLEKKKINILLEYVREKSESRRTHHKKSY